MIVNTQADKLQIIVSILIITLFSWSFSVFALTQCHGRKDAKDPVIMTGPWVVCIIIY